MLPLSNGKVSVDCVKPDTRAPSLEWHPTAILGSYVSLKDETSLHFTLVTRDGLEYGHE